MAYNFVGADRDQVFLLPPSLRDWLPEGHLAWFVLDAVDSCDLSDFYAHYRPHGRGAAAYEPSMMAALLFYAYCVGERSSRAIERRCVEDVAFRVVAANRTPGHATVARFRATHEVALAELFCDVLRLCAEAGLARVGRVALDEAGGAAPAGGTGRLEAEVAAMLAEATSLDAIEDARFGTARGDELPPELAERASRLARLRAARQRLAARDEPDDQPALALLDQDALGRSVLEPAVLAPGFSPQGFSQRAIPGAEAVLAQARPAAGRRAGSSGPGTRLSANEWRLLAMTHELLHLLRDARGSRRPRSRGRLASVAR